MNCRYHVQWSRTASHDAQAILSYIAQESRRTALHLLKQWRMKASTLARHPRRGRALPELAHIPGLPFRELVMTPWRLVYRVDRHTISVLALLDGRRDLADLLHERLIREK